jgi:hypothetical protein
MNSVFPGHLRIIYGRILKHNVIYFKTIYNGKEIVGGLDDNGYYIVEKERIGPFLLPYLIDSRENVIFWR